MLEVVDLSVRVGGRLVLNGVSLAVRYGSIHVVMGPNGSGKSTLAYTIMGREGYEVVGGDIRLDGESILHLKTHERTLRGIMLAFQEPPQVRGVRMGLLLNAMINKRAGREYITDIAPEYLRRVVELTKVVGLGVDIVEREVNVGFSGGEKKRSELLQVMLADPKVVILDEPDSGLDVDGVRLVGEVVKRLRDGGKAVLLITHYARVLKFVEPDEVSVLVNGRVVAHGGVELAYRIEEQGYSEFLKSVKAS